MKNEKDRLLPLIKQVNKHQLLDLAKFTIRGKPKFLPLNEEGNGPNILLDDLLCLCGHKKVSKATKLLSNCLNNTYCMALIGPSGCGKTRSAFEFLAKRYGLFFITNKRFNGGSNDLGQLMKMISSIDEPEMASVKLYEEFANMIYLRIIFLCLLIDTFAVSAIKNKDYVFTPLHWLLMQEMPARFFGNDYFLLMANQFDLTNLTKNGANLVQLKLFENSEYSKYKLDGALFDLLTKEVKFGSDSNESPR